MTDYVAYIIGQLASFGPMRARSMFGGFGIYKDGIIVGMVIENELYFKTDKESAKEYAALDSEPFSYHKDGKVITMSYWKVPADVLENRDRLSTFAFKAYTISASSKKNKK